MSSMQRVAREFPLNMVLASLHRETEDILEDKEIVCVYNMSKL